jgi:hypothetical protein
MWQDPSKWADNCADWPMTRAALELKNASAGDYHQMLNNFKQCLDFCTYDN